VFGKIVGEQIERSGDWLIHRLQRLRGSTHISIPPGVGANVRGLHRHPGPSNCEVLHTMATEIRIRYHSTTAAAGYATIPLVALGGHHGDLAHKNL
jgi:hypothetical protein